jgi:hypothetical protein
MRKKAILIALSCIIITGCATQRIHQECPAYSQCDEMYPGYNCDIQQRTLSTTQYPTTYAPIPWYYSNNAYYTPNVQTVYYVPVSDVLNSPSTTNRPRPSIYHNHGGNSGNNGTDNTNTNIHRKPVVNAPSSRKKRN